MPDSRLPTAALLSPGRNCWRRVPARRAALIIDGERYFDLAERAIRRARHSVTLLAWDFVPETVLRPGSGSGLTIGGLLGEVKAARPELAVRVLVWETAAYFALKRGQWPGVQIGAGGAEVEVRFDDCHPPLACHHQKVLVIDDALAFCGGMDFADNRWDTPRHWPGDPRRISSTGDAYEPRHDVMMAVDGAAARALGDLARHRWLCATGERLQPCPDTDTDADGGDLWPDDLAPDLRDVEIGIARTLPAWEGRPAIYECELLYLDAIAAARRSIYFESQYFASQLVADALLKRLAEPDGPEAVVVVPESAPTWIEQEAMDAARSRLSRRIGRQVPPDRFRILAPMTGAEPLLVHSKLMVVDDRLVRVGSANLSERSFGTDTECDLAIEAGPGRSDQRAAIARFRDTLLAEHLGTDAATVAAAIARTGSLIRAIDHLNNRGGRWLAPVVHTRHDGLLPRFLHDLVADPHRPWSGYLVPAAALAAGAVAGALLGAALSRNAGRPSHRTVQG
ncbi:MAG TPA: phospholipase D-like domain-containing protein [Azospirillaceae bacterium]|nr:phospholipase D-like domain-containing protein [Azospirillaceae bacterium]